jgi:hypothetical protein
VYPWLLINSNLLQLLISIALAAPTQWHCQTASHDHRDALHACRHRRAHYGVIPRRHQQAKHVIASNIEVEMMVVVFSHDWKLWNISFVPRDDSTLFWESYVAWRCTTKSSVCGDQGAGPEQRARCGVVGEHRLFGRSMDEKALSMMVLFQDISRYVEGSRRVKVLLLSCSMASRTERRQRRAHRGNTNSEAEYANNKNCTPNTSSADRSSQIILANRSQH